MQSDAPKPKLTKASPRKKGGVLAHHSLSIVSVGVLILWTVLYAVSNPKTHWGSFFGNAIADWSGVVVTVLATKYLYERGSTESRKPPKSLQASAWEKNNRSLPYPVSAGDRPLLGGRLPARRPRIEMGTGGRQRSLGMDADSGSCPDDQAPDRDALERKSLMTCLPGGSSGSPRKPLRPKTPYTLPVSARITTIRSTKPRPPLG